MEPLPPPGVLGSGSGMAGTGLHDVRILDDPRGAGRDAGAPADAAPGHALGPAEDVRAHPHRLPAGEVAPRGS